MSCLCCMLFPYLAGLYRVKDNSLKRLKVTVGVCVTVSQVFMVNCTLKYTRQLTKPVGSRSHCCSLHHDIP